MKTTYRLSEILPGKLGDFGAKAGALLSLHQAGFKVPATVCISSAAYEQFVRHDGLQERIQLELNRKKFSDMRWEEIWDAALRIRNLFSRTELPEKMIKEISTVVWQSFADLPVVVRSSAPEEDTAGTSFAGLHESFVNISGAEAILDHIKLVWASLWSDRALLYRQELDLDISKSTMAVVVQELIAGEVSGVTFSVNPSGTAEGVVEAVYGLNQGLVDGEIEPDHWLLDRNTNSIKVHREPKREKFMIPEGRAVILKDLPPGKMMQAPLRPKEVLQVYGKATRLEEFFGRPQDVEWTKVGGDIIILQSRPVTAGRNDNPEDKRGWYLSLHRSHQNLKKLRVKIEQQHFPAMIKEAEKLAAINLQYLSESELAAEIEKRRIIKDKWTGIYWDDFIPFAHGMRIFGRFYNDIVNPLDPFEFIELLAQTPLLSKERNAALQKISIYVREHPALKTSLAAGIEEPEDAQFGKMMHEFINRYGDTFCGMYGDKACAESRNRLTEIILQMAESASHGQKSQDDGGQDKMVLERNFWAKFTDRANRSLAEDLLDLARASYRLRDDDNILLGRIEEQHVLALQEGRIRLKERGLAKTDLLNVHQVIQSLHDREYSPEVPRLAEKISEPKKSVIKARQLLGQPAGPGIGRGRARVISGAEDLGLFKKGEILVCDAIDPNMTLVVPLAAGIVERRGGMLIHGAIIAREYGIACVTGIPKATEVIETGEEVTVDGYLGIVTVKHTSGKALTE